MRIQPLAVEQDGLSTDPHPSPRHLLLLQFLHSNQVVNHNPSPTKNQTQLRVGDDVAENLFL